jgi:hypothetical protein
MIATAANTPIKKQARNNTVRLALGKRECWRVASGARSVEERATWEARAKD